jgi:hypothetical protein
MERTPRLYRATPAQRANAPRPGHTPLDRSPHAPAHPTFAGAVAPPILGRRAHGNSTGDDMGTWDMELLKGAESRRPPRRA